MLVKVGALCHAFCFGQAGRADWKAVMISVVVGVVLWVWGVEADVRPDPCILVDVDGE